MCHKKHHKRPWVSTSDKDYSRSRAAEDRLRSAAANEFHSLIMTACKASNEKEFDRFFKKIEGYLKEKKASNRAAFLREISIDPPTI